MSVTAFAPESDLEARARIDLAAVFPLDRAVQHA